MKHIREYKVFEKNDIDDIKKTCEEILIDLEDSYYMVDVKSYAHKNYGKYNSKRINIFVHLPKIKTIEELYDFYKNTKEVRDETILRLLDYMKHKNCKCLYNSYDFKDSIIKSAHEVKWNNSIAGISSINIIFEIIE